MDISGEKLTHLIRISTIKKLKSRIAIQELIKIINIKRANFSQIKKILIDNDIAIEHGTCGNAKLLDIDIEKLDAFIKDSDIYKLIREYVIFKDPLLHTI